MGMRTAESVIRLSVSREVLPDEHKARMVGSLARAIGLFSEQGIICRWVLSDSGPSCRLVSSERPVGD